MRRRGLLALALMPALPRPARAETTITVGFLGRRVPPRTPTSPLDEVVTEPGLMGARVGLADNLASGRFLHLRFVLAEHVGDDAAVAARHLAAEGAAFIATHLPAPALLAAAEAAPDALLLNAGATEDALRNAACRPNLLHTAPSRAMLADALAQYLAWKRWTRWALVTGRGAGDALLADAYRRAARRFGCDVADEKSWSFRPGPGRADTGHVALQTEIPAFTRGLRDHDVLVVADEDDEFGAWLEGRTARPRPVAGTHGLVATGWSPVVEQWGAAQLQSRFRARAGRRMEAGDYAAWLSLRTVGEAAIQARSGDPARIRAMLRDPDFLLPGYKGQGLSFRAWDGQLRQPVLLAGPRMLISASPQPGFLHQVTPLDTLGHDRPESACRRTG
jgi:ABC transporter substrate binding protein (PQQ-dependent alcohol dehydrogenase system)